MERTVSNQFTQVYKTDERIIKNIIYNNVECVDFGSRSVLLLYYDLNINIILINVGYLMKHLNRLFLYLKLTKILLVYTLMLYFITQFLFP